MVSEKLKATVHSLHRLATDELAWLQGYLTALQQQQGAVGVGTTPQAATQLAQQEKRAVVYATQTGSAQQVAQQVSSCLAISEVLDIATLKPNQLTKYALVIFVVSTHGEGEPPDSATQFTKLIKQKNAKRLDALKFAVIGLGG